MVRVQRLLLLLVDDCFQRDITSCQAADCFRYRHYSFYFSCCQYCSYTCDDGDDDDHDTAVFCDDGEDDHGDGDDNDDDDDSAMIIGHLIVATFTNMVVASATVAINITTDVLIAMRCMVNAIATMAAASVLTPMTIVIMIAVVIVDIM